MGYKLEFIRFKITTLFGFNRALYPDHIRKRNQAVEKVDLKY